MALSINPFMAEPSRAHEEKGQMKELSQSLLSSLSAPVSLANRRKAFCGTYESRTSRRSYVS